MKKFLSFFVIIYAFLLQNIVSAQNIEVKPPTSRQDLFPEIAKTSTGESIASIISYGIGVTAILAVIAVTWAGIAMFLSVGEEEKFNKAKNILIYALVGVGISGGAYLIVKVVSSLSFK